MQRHLQLIMFLLEKMKSKFFIVSAHQPNFMPYLGFFDKMQKSDIFVIRDEVLFVKKEFHNRNKIRINSHDNLSSPKCKWLNVPVTNYNDYILHVLIKKDAEHKNKLWHENILHELKTNYKHTSYFDDFFPKLEEIFKNSNGSLISLNMKIINFLKESFKIKTKIIFASELGLKPINYQKSDASEDLANICKALNANTYLSGAAGKNYLSEKPFIKENIKLEFHDYHHPIYKQNYPEFLSNMSAIDALFCIGSNACFEKQLILHQMVGKN